MIQINLERIIDLATGRNYRKSRVLEYSNVLKHLEIDKEERVATNYTDLHEMKTASRQATLENSK